MFKCPIEGCDGTFSTKQGLTMHNTRSHIIKPAPSVKLPAPGESLKITGLFLNENDVVEVQATGLDGVYLLQVTGFRKR